MYKMLFSSLEFLFLFLPLSLFLYFLTPAKARNGVLLIISLVFYGLGEPRYLLLMLAVTLINWAFALFIHKAKERKRRALSVSLIVIDLSLLALFKYSAKLFGALGFSYLAPALPLGISFYIFQGLSYVLDVKRGDISPEKSPVDFAAYITMFPQLVAGPIVKYSDVSAQLKKRSLTLSRIAEGIRIFSIGLAKKVLVANYAGEMWKKMISLPESELTVLSAWLGIVFFALQIYYDFSGYSDMAKGLGRILGFDFPDNFNYPYISSSIREFWQRWHITLSSWFREYVYIPLGGSRGTRARNILNLFIVWSLTGLWHGSGLGFLLWGVYFFLLLVAEKYLFASVCQRLPKPLKHILTLFLLLIGWLIFASEDIGGIAVGAKYLLRMFGVGSVAFSDEIALRTLLRTLPFLAVSFLGSTPIPKKAANKLLEFKKAPTRTALDLLAVLSLIISTAYLLDSAYNPFLYFRF